jgi:hypothetical protein
MLVRLYKKEEELDQQQWRLLVSLQKNVNYLCEDNSGEEQVSVCELEDKE